MILRKSTTRTTSSASNWRFCKSPQTQRRVLLVKPTRKPNRFNIRWTSSSRTSWSFTPNPGRPSSTTWTRFQSIKRSRKRLRTFINRQCRSKGELRIRKSSSRLCRTKLQGFRSISWTLRRKSRGSRKKSGRCRRNGSRRRILSRPMKLKSDKVTISISKSNIKSHSSTRTMTRFSRKPLSNPEDLIKQKLSRLSVNVLNSRRKLQWWKPIGSRSRHC